MQALAGAGGTSQAERQTTPTPLTCAPSSPPRRQLLLLPLLLCRLLVGAWVVILLILAHRRCRRRREHGHPVKCNEAGGKRGRGGLPLQLQAPLAAASPLPARRPLLGAGSSSSASSPSASRRASASSSSCCRERRAAEARRGRAMACGLAIRGRGAARGGGARAAEEPLVPGWCPDRLLIAARECWCRLITRWATVRKSSECQRGRGDEKRLLSRYMHTH